MSYWVVDANIAVNTVLSVTDKLLAFWERVDREQIIPSAPRLWISEVTSALRFWVSQKELTEDEAEDALRTIYGLKIEIVDEDEELSLRALELAGKLRQSKAYDAFYLALAEKLKAEFWTADNRLANRCRKDLKLHWVHSLEEI